MICVVWMGELRGKRGTTDAELEGGPTPPKKMHRLDKQSIKRERVRTHRWVLGFIVDCVHPRSWPAAAESLRRQQEQRSVPGYVTADERTREARPHLAGLPVSSLLQLLVECVIGAMSRHFILDTSQQQTDTHHVIRRESAKANKSDPIIPASITS